MVNQFKKEFNFIFKTKEQMGESVTIEAIQEKIQALQKIYCLDFYKFDETIFPEKQRITHFFDDMNYLYSDKSIVRDYESYARVTKEAKSITLPLLNKKHQMLQKIQKQHAELMEISPDLYSLRFSLNLQATNMSFGEMLPLQAKGRCVHMTYFVSKLLNNMRQRAHLKNKIGHFWCFMKEPDGTPYIHINIYFRHGKFNAARAMDFLDLWMSVTNRTGICILFDFPKHYNNTVIYNSKNIIEQIKFITIPKMGTTANHIVVDDFNQANSNWKYTTEASDKSFQDYLYQVVRETYPVYTLSAYPQVFIPDDIPLSADKNKFEVKGQKVRSYALSQ